MNQVQPRQWRCIHIFCRLLCKSNKGRTWQQITHLLVLHSENAQKGEREKTVGGYVQRMDTEGLCTTIILTCTGFIYIKDS